MSLDQALKYAADGTSYEEKVQLAFPASRDPADPANRKMRERLTYLGNIGYDHFQKNVTEMFRVKESGNLDKVFLFSEIMNSYTDATQSSADSNNVPDLFNKKSQGPIEEMKGDENPINAYQKRANRELSDP